MCSIVGAVLRCIDSQYKLDAVNGILEHIWKTSHERGRDGRGFVINSSAETDLQAYREVTRSHGRAVQAPALLKIARSATVVGNLRAEPTTEFVLEKRLSDQQPYTSGDWTIAHNGTIANDKALRTNSLPTTIDSAAIAEQLANTRGTLDDFAEVIRRLRGSYAILATHSDHTDKLFVAANYRPVWYIDTPYGVFFASSRDYLPQEYPSRMLKPYTAAVFDANGLRNDVSLYSQGVQGERALVVCSGGLDSVVSAAYAQRELGMGIHLIHFLYGSRAEGPEVKAIEAVAEYLGAELTLFPLNVYSKGDSPLLDPDSKVAGGEAGAEFAHEWVPARNLLLLSVATAFAEARGIDTIVLGNNLEEAGAYPDNEPEFIARFNDLLPFAVGDGKRMRVIMPVGNLMKHEIVELGNRIGAPMHLTWSCYRAGELHCGTCGPCYMRRKAFEINNIPEVISYKDEQ
jgi:7-cyano-7-deazaguanine synthase